MIDFDDNLSQFWMVYSPTKILFGVDSINELGKVISKYGNSAFIISGRSAVKNGLVERCGQLLTITNISFELYDSVTSDPDVTQVNEICDLLRINKCDVLIAIGGGSVIDAAKAASVIIKQGGIAENYLLEGKTIIDESLPLIAVPTTAGTGSELSKGAILSSAREGIKSGLRGDALFPEVAIVDPTLTLTLPSEQVKITGFDVFTHAVETYISRKANQITKIFSREAIKAICRFLPKVLEKPEDMEARNNMSFYSMIMGYNLANSSTCLPHRLQYPLGISTGSPHALGLAMLYPSWIEITENISKQRFKNIAKWMAIGMSIEDENQFNIKNIFDEFMSLIDLKPKISDLQVNEQLCLEMANKVGKHLENDPWWEESKDISLIYLSALKNAKISG